MVLRAREGLLGQGRQRQYRRDNFDEIRYEYFRDTIVALEAFKGDALDWRTENSAKNWATAYDFPAVKDGRVIKEEFPIRASGRMQAFVFNITARQVQGPARAPGAQLRLRFRGDEQAAFLRPVPAHQQLFRRHRACLLGIARGQGAGNPRGRARQGTAGSLHQAVQESGRRHGGEHARESARGDATVARGRLRDTQPEAHQRKDWRNVLDRVPHFRSEY